MQLSTSSLQVFSNCKRCFYLDKKHKAPRPRGIFPSLPGGVDGILKKRLDSFRAELPEELNIPKLQPYRLFQNEELLKGFRQWNSKGALKYVDAKGNVMVGGLDDILETGMAPDAENVLVPLDYKTKGSEPCQEDCEKYYQLQLDIYALLLSTRYAVEDFGVLLYFWPIEDAYGLVKFESKPFIIQTDKNRAIKTFEDALACLEGGLPDADPLCEYCKCYANRAGVLE